MNLLKDGALMVGCELNDTAITNIHRYLDELLAWNLKTNLTGLKDEKEILVSLFIDSLAVGKALSPIKRYSILDIGSGAGFPGLPLKIAYPELGLTFVEPNFKKVAFLHHVIGTLNLSDTIVYPNTIQDLTNNQELHGKYNFVLIKALQLNACLPYLKPLISPEGKVIYCRGKSLKNYGEITEFRLVGEIPYELPYGFGNRALSILMPS